MKRLQKNINVAPSLLAADFSKLGDEIRAVVMAGADWLHLDIMDGCFVPNLTFGPAVVQDIRPCTDIPFDVHLMICNPEKYIDRFAVAGADYITVHYETNEEKIPLLISQIKKHGKKVGISICPTTNICVLTPYIPDIDLILVMSVQPGFGGQSFQKEAIAKLAAARELVGNKPVLISVDGGINDVTAPAVKMAGANVLVAGSYIFKHQSYETAIKTLKRGKK